MRLPFKGECALVPVHACSQAVAPHRAPLGSNVLDLDALRTSKTFCALLPRVPDVGKMPNEYRYMPTSIRPMLSDPSCVRDSHLHRRSSIARTCLYVLQTCMYRLHTHPAAYGIGTSMPLLGLLASCASIFPANGRVPL